MPKTEFTLPGSVAMDLRGKQSVRATFKLSEKAIDSLSLVAVHLGIKQKSLFDHLIDDAQALRTIAENVRIRQFNKIERIQKTFVLSRRTLDVLELIAKDHDTPRDALVEYAVKQLEDVIQMEKKKHLLRKKLYQKLDAQWNKAMALYDESRETLGEEDPFCRHLEKNMVMLAKTRGELDVFLQKSSVLESY